MPRLKRGELAPGIARKAEQNAISVSARLKLLDQLESPDAQEVDASWVDAFLRQDRLAAFRMDELGITPMSEKTLRRYLVLQGTSMEELTSRARRLVKTRVQNLTTDDAAVGKAVHEEGDTVERTLDITARYLDLLERLEKVRTSFSAVDSLLDRHLRLFADDRPTRIRRIK